MNFQRGTRSSRVAHKLTHARAFRMAVGVALVWGVTLAGLPTARSGDRGLQMARFARVAREVGAAFDRAGAASASEWQIQSIHADLGISGSIARVGDWERESQAPESRSAAELQSTRRSAISFFIVEPIALLVLAVCRARRGLRDRSARRFRCHSSDLHEPTLRPPAAKRGEIEPSVDAGIFSSRPAATEESDAEGIPKMTHRLHLNSIRRAELIPRPLIRCCIFCNKIEASDGSRASIETYIRDAFGVVLSRGMCNACYDETHAISCPEK